MRIIAGSARGRRIEAPPGRDTRPTLDRVRENLFNMLQGRIQDARVLDPFAGSGALSLEALSRGAACAVLGDHDRRANMVQQKNAALLGFEKRARILLGDWQRTLRLMREEGQRFDIVFLDPPYVMTDLRDVMCALQPLLAEDAWVVVEHEAKAEITAGESFTLLRQRSWGYCGVSFFGLAGPENAEGDKA